MFLGDSPYKDIFNNVMSETTPGILAFSIDSMKEELIPTLLDTVNTFLDEQKIPSKVITDCFLLNKCPF